jgi:hypothetical protein
MARWSEAASRSWSAFGGDCSNFTNRAEAEQVRRQIVTLASQGQGRRSAELVTLHARFLVHYDGPEIVDIEQTWKSGVWSGEEW